MTASSANTSPQSDDVPAVTAAHARPVENGRALTNLTRLSSLPGLAAYRVTDDTNAPQYSAGDVILVDETGAVRGIVPNWLPDDGSPR